MNWGPTAVRKSLRCSSTASSSALIAQVHAYRGSVIGFSGDAITCWFDGDDGRRATACRPGDADVMDNLDPAGGSGSQETAIGIKVAVAAGIARRFLTGDPAVSYVEVLAGNILERAAAAEKLAEQGDVILSSEVCEALGDDLAVRVERNNAHAAPYYVVDSLKNPSLVEPWPAMPPLAAEVARQWILPPVYERLELGTGQFVSELRQATAVFLKFGGIDYDQDEAAGEKLDAFVRWVQSILARYGGSLSQVSLGDKGSYLLCVFGAPVAHEDDTARALNAALEFIKAPAVFDSYEPPLGDIQVGVNRGLIYAGTYGGSGSMTYGILGDATNVAARLMEQAEPGQILVAARLAKGVGKEFEFRLLGQVLMKGMEGPMALASLVERRTTEDSRPSSLSLAAAGIVGRAAERTILKTALQGLAAGESQILIIEGEAGIGKSSLVAELAAGASQAGIETLEGAGDAIENASPYFAWRRILYDLFGIGRATGMPGAALEEVVSTYLETVDPELPHLAPLLNTVLPVNFPENELTGGMAGEIRADNLNRLLTGVLAARTAAAPLVLILDDAHWLDSASWALARRVAREVQPLLLVVALRPLAIPPPDYEFLRRAPRSTVLSLELLSGDEILTIVGRRLGVAELPPPVARLILDKAEGHPFFGEELAYALRDAGYIRVVNSTVHLSTTTEELERLTFPDTIQGVITSRIDRVSAQQQLVLKVASVIGRIFAYHILRDIYPVESSDQALHSDLIVLEELDITPLELPDPQLAYIFRHIIMQEVTYGLLTFDQRRRLHRAAAEWYEIQQAADLSSIYALLAYHWTAAEVPEKAIPYALEAGGQALENGAFREAVKHFSDGLEWNKSALAITDPVELAEWFYLLGIAHRHIGQAEMSLSNLSAALDLLERPFPSGRVALMAGLMGQVSRQMLHRAAPRFFDWLVRTPPSTRSW